MVISDSAERNTSAARNLVLVDVENYCGKPVLAEHDVETAKKRIEACVNAGDGDLYVVATSHRSNFLSAKLSWKGVEHVFLGGHNGADIALIDAAKRHFSNLTSFRGVFLFSGDGIFTSMVRELVKSGVPTTVVSSASQLNRSLAAAASTIQLVQPHSVWPHAI